ncbi:hypothetical protein Dimus_026956 [Dionaea muscipula]
MTSSPQPQIFESLCKEGDWMLNHAADVYTRALFNKFKFDWASIWQFKIEKEERNPDLWCFHLKTRDKVKGYKQQFVVQLNPETYVGTCECKKWEFSGMICMHIMKVFDHLDLEEIPEHFILGRWRKKANVSFRVMDQPHSTGDGDNEHAEVLRLNHLCKEMTQLACRSAPHEDAYLLCVEGVKELSQKVDALITSKSGVTKVVANVNDQPEPSNADMPQIILDPLLSQTKGRKRDARGKEVTNSSTRIKSGLELATNKRKRNCRCCGKLVAHDTRTCPQNPKNLQKNKEGDGASDDDTNEDEDDIS